MLRLIFDDLGISSDIDEIHVRGESSVVVDLIASSESSGITIHYAGVIAGGVCLVVNDFSPRILGDVYKIPDDTEVVQAHPIDLKRMIDKARKAGVKNLGSGLDS